jgi:acyl-CoA reductase-like NAD-dependent aldehyde dehydrogenase
MPRIGEIIMKAEGMTRADVEAALARAGLDIPEREKAEIATAAHFVEEMVERLRRRRDMAAEPAHIFPPPGS